jgi:exonuclease III
LQKNVDELQVFINEENPDVLCLSEHHLRQNEFNNISLTKFVNVSAFCRKNMLRGGGVCILVKKDIKYNIVDVSSYCHEGIIELSAISVYLSTKETLILAIYRPPNSNVDVFFNALDECLEFLLSFKTIFVLGDFNINIERKDLTTCKLLNIMKSFHLTAQIKNYTREFKGSKSIIDNIFTNYNEEKLFCSVIVSALSDHHAQMCQVNCDLESLNGQPLYVLKRIINENNIATFKKLLQKQSWHEIYLYTDVNQIAETFMNILNTHFNEAFPLKNCKLMEYNKKNKIKLSTNLISLRKKVKQLYYKSKDLESFHPLRIKYKKLKNLFKSNIRKEKTNEFHEKIKKSDNKIRSVWELINENISQSKRSSFHQIFTIKDSHNNLVQDPSKIANMFNPFYVNTYKRLSPTLSLPTTKEKNNYNSPVHSIFFHPVSTNEVKNLIKSLKSKQSAGIDEISSKLLKEIDEYVVEPLVYLINKAFTNGQFPNVFKISIIKPIFKKGSAENLENFRPISLISTFSKIMEKAMYNRLTEFLTDNKIIFHQQFGFLKGKSTTHAVFHLTKLITDALDKGNSAVSTFIDLTKAFDLVNHHILLRKLQQVGIRGIPLKIIESYLIDRQQIVKIPYVSEQKVMQYAFSDEKSVKCGVPQGSILGPLFFLIYINNVQSSVSKADICLYADDTTITLSGYDRNTLERNLFLECNCLLQWFNSILLQTNTDKTNMMEFSIRNSKNTIRQISNFLGDNEIQHSDEVNFLGITLDKHLNFKEHIYKISKKISSGLFILRRISQIYPYVNIQLTLYYGIIYPYLVNGVPIWGGESCRTIYLFKLQKKIIRTIFKVGKTDSCKKYFKENKILTFPSIYILQTLIFVKRNLELFTEKEISTNYELRTNLNVKTPKHKTSFFEKHLYFQGIRLYNALPVKFKHETNINKFKKELKIICQENAFYKKEDYYNYFKLIYNISIV